MSSDDEEYANDFIDDADEDISPGSIPALFRPGRGGLYPGSPLFRFTMSSSSSPGMGSGKFMFIISSSSSSYGYNTTRSRHQPLKKLEVKTIEENSEGQSHTNSRFSKPGEATHNSGLNHLDSNSSEEEATNHLQGQQKVKGHNYQDREANLNKNQELNEENEVKMSDEEGGNDKVKSQIKSQKIKGNSFSLVDDKPIAQMFKKDCDRTDDIIKSIWSRSSKSSLGQRSNRGQGGQYKSVGSTNGEKNNNKTKTEVDRTNPTENVYNNGDNSNFYKGQRSVRENHGTDDSCLPPGIKSMTGNKHVVENSSDEIKPKNGVTMVTKTESGNSGRQLLDGPMKGFPKKKGINKHDDGITEFSWQNGQYTRLDLSSHIRSNEENFNSIEEDTSPLSHSGEGAGRISHSGEGAGVIPNRIKGTDLKSHILEDMVTKSTEPGSKLSRMGHHRPTSKKSGSTSYNTGDPRPASTESASTSNNVGDLGSASTKLDSISNNMGDPGQTSTQKVQMEATNSVSWNRIIKNKEIETESLFAIRAPNEFGQILQPNSFENNLIKSCQESKKTSITAGENDNTEGDQSSSSQRSRTSDGSDKIFSTFQDEGAVRQPPAKPQRSLAAAMTSGTFSSFQDTEDSGFGSGFASGGSYGYENEDDGYVYSGSTGKSNRSGYYRQYSYGAKGIKTMFRRMQKMMTGMKTFADESGFQICDVSNDGNCMFAAVVDQLNLSGDFRYTTTSLRHAAVKYLEQNPCHEDGSHLSSFLDHESWEGYLTRMDRDTEWGDHLILTAIVEVIQRCITVYNVSPTTKSDTTLKPSRIESDQSEILYLGHYGEEHFVSLRPKTWESTWYKKAALKAQLQPMNAENPEVQTSLGQGGNVNPDQQTADILENRFGMDPMSGTPLPHLSYIIKALLHSKCITTNPCPYSLKFDSSGMRGYNTCRTLMTGSAVEDLNFNLSDLSYYTQCSCSRDPFGLSEDECLTVFVYQEYNIGFPHQGFLNRYDFSINTNYTHPGYVRLEPVSQRYDFSKYLEYKETGPFLKHFKTGLKGSSSWLDKRMVTGVEFHDMLSVALEWIQRDRPSKWPSSTIIEEITKSSCILAAKPHPNSVDPDIEWQILFPEAEKILATKALSQEQRYCFSVFKVLVDCQTRELEDKLSTNHLKSILYFTCEVAPPSCWHENIGGIVLYMIQKLSESLREGQLPNYFLKENNMIDHFSDQGRQLLEEKIEAIRLFPVMSILFIAKRHGILCSSAIDCIIDDFERYRSEGGLIETIQSVFVPSTMKLAKSQSYYGINPQQMFNIVNSAYEELLVLAKSQSSIDIPEFPEFFKKLLLSEKDEKNRFLCAFCFDSHYHTSLNESLFEGTETKTLQEVVGTEIEEKYGNLKIPINLISSPIAAARFLDDIAHMLYSSQEYDNSAYFLRCGIAKVKKQLTDDGSINLTEIVDDEVRSDIVKQNYTRIQSLNVLLYNMLQHLYIDYQQMGQTDLFFEYMEDLEEVSDRMGDSSVYKWVSKLWEHFGSEERANVAKNKMQATVENSDGNPFGLASSKGSTFLLIM